jgi:cytochrome c biogenesis protein CcdA
MLDFVTSQAGGWFLPVIVTAAAIDSVNPCAFSILFLTLTFLFSLGKNRKFILFAGGMYILGIALVYTLIGVGMLQVLSILNIPNGLAKVGALILVLYCIIGIINEFFPTFPIKLKIPTTTHQTLARVIHKATVPTSFFLGILVGLFEFPCTGGPYLFVLGLLHDHTSFWNGFAYLIIYNIVFVAPLIIMLIVATNRGVLEKLDRLRKLETRKSRLVLLSFLLVIAIVIFFL